MRNAHRGQDMEADFRESIVREILFTFFTQCKKNTRTIPDFPKPTTFGITCSRGCC